MIRKFILVLLLCVPAFATVRNVKLAPCNAAGNGSANDLGAINTCIGNLVAGDTLYFPTGTYKITGALNTITVSVEVKGDGAGLSIIKDTGSGGTLMLIGSGGISTATAFLANTSKLATSFTATVSTMGGVTAGNLLQTLEGGRDGSGGNTDAGTCDVSGCRGEVVKVASVSGNTITTTAPLNFAYTLTSGGVMNYGTNACTASSTVTNCASVVKLSNVIANCNVHDLQFQGSGTAQQGLEFQNTDSCLGTNLTFTGFTGTAFERFRSWNDKLTNITVTAAGGNGGGNGAAVAGQYTGHEQIIGMSVTAINSGGFGCQFGPGGGGFFQNITCDKTGTGAGRPVKTIAQAFSWWDNITVKGGSVVAGNPYNGFDPEYYSSNDLITNCTMSGNATANVNTFGNFNDFLTFYNCTMTTGTNGGVTNINPGASALSRRDLNLTLINGTVQGSDSNSEVQVNGNNFTAIGVHVGPGSTGQGGFNISSNPTTGNCVNTNTFTSGLAYSYAANGSTGFANGNTLGTAVSGTPLPTGSCAMTGNPTSLNLGTVSVGQTSIAQSVAVTNPLSTFSNVYAFGDFAETDNCGASSSCTVNVTFSPTVAGARTGYLLVFPTTTGGTLVVPLSGTGGTGTVVLTPNPISLSFGNVPVGTTSNGQLTTITNTGNTSTVITSVTATGDYAQTNNCGTLVAGGSCNITATFTPTAIGTRTGNIAIVSTAQTLNVPLTGNGVALTVSPLTLGFGSVVIGKSSSSQPVTVTNTNNIPLTVTTAITGSFTKATTCNSLAANGGSCTVNVTFSPLTTGTLTGTLTVTPSIGNAVNVALSGTGTPDVCTAGLPYQNARCDLNPVAFPAIPPQVGPNACTAGALNSCGNLTGKGTIITDPNFNTRIVRLTDSTFGHTGNLFQTLTVTESGSGDEQRFNSSSPPSMVLIDDAGGRTFPATFSFAANPPSQKLYVANPTWSPHNGFFFQSGVFFGYALADKNLVFQIGNGQAGGANTNGTKFGSWDFTDLTNPPSFTSITDFATSTCLGTGYAVTWSTVGGADQSDNDFAFGFSNAGNQGTGVDVVVYRKGSGCRHLNVQTLTITGDWGATGAVTGGTTCTGQIHNVKIFKVGGSSGAVLVNYNQGCVTGRPGFVWFYTGTDFINVCTSNCSGHETEGVTHYANQPGNAVPNYWVTRPDNAPGTPTGIIPALPPGGVQVSASNFGLDFHCGWNQLDDTLPFVCSTVVPSTTTPTKAWSNEVWAPNPAGNTNPWRFANTEATYLNNDFSTQQAIGAISQDGNYYMFSSDWRGTLGGYGGNTGATGISSCTVGTNCRGDVFVAELNPVTQAVLNISPSSLSFGTQAVGTASATQTVTVSNVGTASASFSSIGFVSGANFQLTNNCGSSLLANSSCTVLVAFKPGVTGSLTDTLKFNDNVSTSPQSVTVSGTGIQAPAFTSANATTFTLNSAGTFTVTTSGGSPTPTLTETGTLPSGVTFTDNGDGTGTLAGTAIQGGAFPITFTASNSAGTVNQAFTLTVIQPVANFVPASLAFGNQTVGGTSLGLTTTFKNTGTSTLAITSIALQTGTQYAITANTCGGSLAPNISCAITVKFSPLSVGALTDNIVFTDSATDSPQLVPLSGTGTASANGAIIKNGTIIGICTITD